MDCYIWNLGLGIYKFKVDLIMIIGVIYKIVVRFKDKEKDYILGLGIYN